LCACACVKAAELVGRLMEKASKVAANPTPGAPPAALTMEDVMEQNRLLLEKLEKKEREVAQGEVEHRVATLFPDATKNAEVSKGIQARCGADVNALKTTSDVLQLIIASGGVGTEGSFRPSGMKRKTDDSTHAGGSSAPATTQSYYQACLAHYSTQRVKVTDGRNTVAETSYVT